MKKTLWEVELSDQESVIASYIAELTEIQGSLTSDLCHKAQSAGKIKAFYVGPIRRRLQRQVQILSYKVLFLMLGDIWTPR